MIYIHCDQTSTSENLYNGKPSTFLNVFPIRNKMVGKNEWIEYSSPLRKNLIAGTLNELSFKIKDSDGKAMNNHGLPIIISIYGPNFTNKTMKDLIHGSLQVKSFSTNGVINRQDMATINLLMNLSSDIPFKLFWIPSYYKPFFKFSQDLYIIEKI